MMTSKIWSRLLLAFSFLGFIDSAYLSISHFQNRIPPCTTDGCEIVLSSRFAAIGGIPLALFGVGFYMLVFFLVLIGENLPAGRQARWLKPIISIGFAFSIILFLLQAFVLHAFCLYCLGSLGTSTLLFIFVWLPPGNSI